MKILAFDTSNGYCSVAVSYCEEILYYKREQAINTQAECLVPMIEDALSNISLKYKDLDYLAVNIGPGSFTGIRIGLAAAKGILLAAGIKSIAINNFELIHFQAQRYILRPDYIFTAVNAYRGQLYLQIFHKEAYYSECALLPYNEIYNMFSKIKGIKVCAGSGWEQLFSIQTKLPENVIILPRHPYPDSKIICQLAYQNIIRNKVDQPLQPLYIRLPDAKLPL